MTLQKKTITITDEKSRDKGKTFIITEMDAFAAERWAYRAILTVVKNGKMPENAEIAQLKDIDWKDDATANLGIGLVAAMGIRAFAGLDYEEAEPLLNELLEQVQIVGDAGPGTEHKPLPGEIRDFRTLMRLRLEVFELITGFSVSGVLSRLSAIGGTLQTMSTTPISSNGPTSQTP